jgi:hypothetical protein
MMKLLLPGFLVDLILPIVFSETKGYVKECRRSRIDLDEHIQAAIKEWISR